jgi:outer membrane protein assembly factor BamB
MKVVRAAGFALPVLAAVMSVGLLAAAETAGERFWPQWRGPEANGVSRHADPPLEWSETRNIRWKVEIPGRGSASPVIWGDRLYLLTAIPASATLEQSHARRGGKPKEAHRYVVYAIDRRTGRIVWERTANEAVPNENSQENNTWASGSAVTDGEVVVAFFESQGLYVYDMEGKLLWQKDLGKKTMRNEFGEGTTPALSGNRIVIVRDHRGSSFIVALDKRTGAELWRTERKEIDSWATPLIVEHAGRAQVVTSGQNRLRSYDLATGELIWDSEGVTMNPIPSPVAADGLVFVTSGFQGSNLKAVRLADARGDISKSGAIVWTLDADTPYVPSPLLYDGLLYLIKSNSPILSAFDAKTGTPHFRSQRLDGLAEVYSSPVGAAGRVYITGRDGTTLVIKRGPTFEVLAKNTLNDGFDASPALVDGDMYMRGYKYLYDIAAR